MPGGLLTKLGLKRKKNANQPAGQQVQQAAAITPPVVQQQPVVQQAPVVPQRPVQPVPQQQAWQAADKTGRKAQAGPLNQEAEKKQEAFQEKLAAAMPEIRRAKQVALTVDGKRIEVSKSEPESKLAKTLAILAGQLTPQIKVVDGHTSEVRKKAEALDFGEAEKELAKAHSVALDMLALEVDYQLALLEAGQNVQTSLAGEPSPEQKTFEEEWQDAQITLNSTIALQSGNGAVKREQADLQKLITEARKTADKNDFSTASKLLNDAVGNCQVIEMLAQADVAYHTERSAQQRLVSVVQSIDPSSNAGQDRQKALDSLTQSEAAADKGKFTDANRLLEQFKQLGETLAPLDDLDARMYPEALANMQPHVKQALAVDVPCQPVIEIKQKLPTMLADSQAAADQRDFRNAYDLLEAASILVNRALQFQRSWEDYANAEDDAKPILDAVKKLRLADQKQAADQKTIIADSERATKDAMAGKLTDATKLLQSAVDRASGLLSAAADPAAAEYFKEWAAIRSLVEDAEAVSLTAKPIVDAQRELAEARGQVNESVNANDYQGAIYGLGVVDTRAQLVQLLAEHYADYERAEQAFAKQFAIAQAADAKLPGVAALQQQFTRDLMAARGASATDPTAGKKLLFTALKSANRIAELAERMQAQNERGKELGDVLGKVKQSYMAPGAADTLGGLADGKEFDAVLAALKAAETDKSPQKLDQLDKAARAWLAVFDKMQDDQKADQQTVRRKGVCDTALKQAKHLQMAAKFDSLGPPPWPQDKEDQAADLYVTMMLETGDLPLESAGGGVTGAKWIKNMDFEEGKGKRQFVFKRTDVPPPTIQGFPENGEAPREVLGNEIGRQLKAMTGIDFNAPETRIVSIDGGKLPNGTPGTPVAGSAQAAAPCLGSVVEVFRKNPDVFKQVPAREMQKMAMFDMVSLNMDRHQDNFLITPPTDGQPPQMVPIDNGLALPDREGFNARRGKYAGGKALEWFPQAHEKFDDEMIASIDAIDPDEIIAGMKARLDAMDRENPQLDVKGKVKQESFDMVKNSVEFMKAASKELSPVFMMDALMTKGDDLLFGTPQERAEKTKEVVEKAKRNQDAYAPLASLDWDQKKVYYDVLSKLGWRMEVMDPTFGFYVSEWDGWGRRNAEKVVAIHDKKIPCPATVAENKQLLAEIKQLDPNSTIDSKIQGQDIRKTNKLLVDEAKELREKQEILAAFNQINTRFKEQLQFDQLKDKERFKIFKKYQDFVRWGGEKMTEINGQPFKKHPFEDVYNTLAEQIGPNSDHNRMLKLVASPDFPRMQKLLEQYGSPLDIKREKPEEVAKRLDRFREFERLGGMKGLADVGFDLEAFDSTFKELIAVLQAGAMMDQVDVG
jgi:hypothetical protein